MGGLGGGSGRVGGGTVRIGWRGVRGSSCTAAQAAWPCRRGLWRRWRLWTEAKAVGKWQVKVTSWIPAKLLMFIRTFSPLETQRSYRTRKSAVVVAVVFAVAAGGGGLQHRPF
jgi:hypothetical protein